MAPSGPVGLLKRVYVLLSKKPHDKFDVVYVGMSGDNNELRKMGRYALKQSVDRDPSRTADIILDIILFVVLGFLAFMFVGIVLFPSPYPSSESGKQASGMNEFMVIVLSSPIAAVAVIIGLIKYRLWRSWLFWILLVVSAYAVFTQALMTSSFTGGDVQGARIVAALLAPLVAVPLWQLIMGVSMAVSRRRQL